MHGDVFHPVSQQGPTLSVEASLLRRKLWWLKMGTYGTKYLQSECH